MAKKDLIPFKKGDDPKRNTTGLNRGHPHYNVKLKELLKEYLATIPEGGKERRATTLINRIGALAIAKGDVAMIRMIWEYIEGKPTDNVNVTGALKVEISEAIAKKNHVPTSDTGDSSDRPT